MHPGEGLRLESRLLTIFYFGPCLHQLPLDWRHRGLFRTVLGPVFAQALALHQAVLRACQKLAFDLG